MRGLGQIAELCEIAEPDIGVITNVGPVHLELLGTLEAIAEAKAELLQGLGDGGRAIVPVDAEALEPHLADSLETITFGPGGDVHARLVARSPARSTEARDRHAGRRAAFRLPVRRGPQPDQRPGGCRGRHRARARRRSRWHVGRPA